MALGELVTFESENGIALDGLFYGDPTWSRVVLHVHGSYGNFYQNPWLRTMAQVYCRHHIAFLPFNLSSHDGLAEGFRGGQFEYIGGAIVPFEECLADIGGAIQYLKAAMNHESLHIILQGHSLGCDRVLYYLLERGTPHDFVLLGPCDSYQLHANWIAPRTVDEHVRQLRTEVASGIGDHLLWNEYGVRQGREDYVIPILRRTLLRILEGSLFKIIRLNTVEKWKLSSRCAIYIGGRDDLQTRPPEEMFAYFESRVRDVRRIFVEGGDHELRGCEGSVARSIVEWVDSQER